MRSFQDSTRVRSLFDSIAPHYDFLNHLLSAGLDFYWRRKAVHHLRNGLFRDILDVGCGTADLSIAAARLSPDRIIGIDPAEEMLAIGKQKVLRKGLSRLITLESGRAEEMRFPIASFDAAIVAFGVRNFSDLEKGLSEMHRVLRPGGRIVVLEFSRPGMFLFKQIYFLYFNRLLPLIGRAVSKHSDAYTYLRDSVLKFPEGDHFLSILRNCGFAETVQERLTGGVASIYTGSKL
jgi:demethylmenaquinone methyltransferase/2-methoxy-6-polyprenyl-1,4-benzoquinol methylase